MDLRQPVLRARPSRKSDQAAQDAARLRSHQLPFGARQPGPPRAPHRRLLADADRARRHSQSPGIGHCRVRDAASSSLENRRPCRRDHEPRAPRLRRCMSRSRPLPQLARRAAPARSVTDWACARSPAPIPPTRTKQVDVEPGEKAGRSPTPAASPPSDVKNDRALVNRSGDGDGWGHLPMYMVVIWENVNSIYRSCTYANLPNLGSSSFLTKYSDV